MDFSSQSQMQPDPSEDLTVYVEDLAGPDDYWLSLTDASRVCRVQDVSIRRAIKRGVLPVRRMRAGQNKRTRFVRVSDLAHAGFPVIDESATISKDVGKVDVLNIPRQQQQIVQEQQELAQHLAETRETLSNFQQQISTDLQQQQEYFQKSLQIAQEEQLRQLITTKIQMEQQLALLKHNSGQTFQHLSQEQQNLRRDLTEEQTTTLARDEQTYKTIDTVRQALVDEQAEALTRTRHMQAVLDDLSLNMAAEHAHRLSQGEHFQTVTDGLRQTLMEQQQEVQNQLDDLAMMQQKSLLDYQQTVDTTLQAIQQETQTRFTQLEQVIAAYLQQLSQTFERRLTATVEHLTQSFTQHLSNSMEQMLQSIDTKLAQTLAQAQQSTEHLQQHVENHEQEVAHALQVQQAQLEQHEQLLPLLPYTQQRLVTAQDITTWSQEFAELETQIQNAQREIGRYQPLLDLFSAERMKTLAAVLNQEEIRLSGKKGRQDEDR